MIFPLTFFPYKRTNLSNARILIILYKENSTKMTLLQCAKIHKCDQKYMYMCTQFLTKEHCMLYRIHVS